MRGRRNPLVAREGLWFLLPAMAAVVLSIRYLDLLAVGLSSALLVLLILIFRDPRRRAPSVALGILSPVDGRVVELSLLEAGDTGKPAYSVIIEINCLGTYTARSPIEGRILDLKKNALWVQTDEGDDVVMMFHGYRLGVAPRALARYGERLGLGQRCAYLRLAKRVEVQFPSASKVLVEVGQTVAAGLDLIGTVPSPR